MRKRGCEEAKKQSVASMRSEERVCSRERREAKKLTDKERMEGKRKEERREEDVDDERINQKA